MKKRNILVAVLLLACSSVLFSGCQPASESVEGYASSLITLLQIKQDNQTELERLGSRQIADWPEELVDSILDMIPFSVVSEHALVLYNMIEQGYKPGIRRLSGFSASYIAGHWELENAPNRKTSRSEAKITILQTCDSLNELLGLVLSQSLFINRHNQEDLFVNESTLQVGWKVLDNDARLVEASMEIFNIVEDKHYSLTYNQGAIEIEALAKKGLTFGQLSIDEFKRQDLDKDLLTLIPLDVNQEVSVVYTSYSGHALEDSERPLLAVKSDNGFVPSLDEYFNSIIGFLEVSWYDENLTVGQEQERRILSYMLVTSMITDIKDPEELP